MVNGGQLTGASRGLTCVCTARMTVRFSPLPSPASAGFLLIRPSLTPLGRAANFDPAAVPGVVVPTQAYPETPGDGRVWIGSAHSVFRFPKPYPRFGEGFLYWRK